MRRMKGSPLNPYAPPAVTAESTSGGRAPSTENYRPLFALVTAVTAALAFSVLVEAAVIVQSLTTISVMSRVQAGEEVDEEMISGIDDRNVLVGLSQVAALLAGAIAFAMLTYRASRNALSYGQMLMKFSPGWAVGFYFIPLVSLWKPYYAMKEIWQASDPTGDVHPGSVEVPALLPVWWWAFVVHNLAGQITFRMARAVNDPGSLISAAHADIASAIATIIAALLAIAVARTLAARQDACQKAAEAFRATRRAATPATSAY